MNLTDNKIDKNYKNEKLNKPFKTDIIVETEVIEGILAKPWRGTQSRFLTFGISFVEDQNKTSTIRYFGKFDNSKIANIEKADHYEVILHQVHNNVFDLTLSRDEEPLLLKRWPDD